MMGARFLLPGATLAALLSAGHALGATQIPEEVTKVRDPFKRPISRLSHEKPRSPLELYPVEKFKLVGIITGPRRLRAMLQGPDGKSYFVAEGTAIGVRKGLIRKITHDTVQVRERVLNVLGQEENVDSEMRLPEEGKNVGQINAPIVEPKVFTGGGGGGGQQSGGGQPGGGGQQGGGGGQPGGGAQPGGASPGNPGAQETFGAESPVGSGGSNRQGGSG